MPAQHTFLRNTNALSILQFIRSNGESTRREIQAFTGLSWAAVSTITAELIGQKILVERPQEERLPGRNPNLLDFNITQNLSIGVDVNVEGLTVVLLDLRGRVLDCASESLNEPEKNAVLMQMTRMTEEVLRKNNLEKNRLLGIGISVQGSVDKEGAVSVYNRYIRDWKDVNLKEQLEEYFGVPVRVIHDPVCIALTEQCDNPLLQKEDFALIRLAFGIGMSYVHRGRTVNGHQGTAGELGRVVMNYGDAGGLTLEDYCSVRGIARRVYELCMLDGTVDDVPFLDHDIDSLNRYFQIGSQMAEQGDTRYVDVFREAAKYLGIGIANLVNILNPQYIILTGAFLDYNLNFVEQVRHHARQSAWQFSDFEILISPQSRLNAARGAATHFINAAFEDQDSVLLKRQ